MRVFARGRTLYRAGRVVIPELSQKELDRLRALTTWQETGDV